MPKRDKEAVSRGLNDLFGSSGAGDLLGNVIQSDRKRTGRPASLPPEPMKDEEPPGKASGEEPEPIMTSHNVLLPYDNMTDKQYDNKASHKAIKQADKLSEKSGGSSSRRSRPKPIEVKSQSLLNARIEEGEGMAKSPTTTVTLRLPREMNDWLDEYVHRAWPTRVRKQQLVIEALQMLFARRGRPGEPTLETEFLSKDGHD